MQCSDFIYKCAAQLLNAWAAQEVVGDTCDVALVFDSLIKLRDSLADGSIYGRFSIDDLPF